MRKVLGSNRRQLIIQFLSESVSLSVISLILSVVLVTVVLPAFNSLSGKEFSSGDLLNLPILLGLLEIILLTEFIAGSFPAFVLSGFSPISVLRGKFSSASRNSSLRKILVVVQFSISIFLVIGIFSMVRQLQYMKNKDLGFNKDQLAVILNESAAEAFGWGKDALGKRILNVPRDNRPGLVVGIVRDFHNDNMRLSIPPSILSLRSDFFIFVTARLRSPWSSAPRKSASERFWVLPSAALSFSFHGNLYGWF